MSSHAEHLQLGRLGGGCRMGAAWAAPTGDLGSISSVQDRRAVAWASARAHGGRPGLFSPAMPFSEPGEGI